MKRKFLIFVFFLLSALTYTAPIKVGLLLSMGGLGDKSFNDSAYRGLMRAKKDFDIEVKYVEPSSWLEDGVFLEEYSQNGFDLIIATSYTALDAMEEIATKFPNTKYAIVDAEAKEGNNIASLVFDEAEGSFLVGVIAAQMSKSGKIGFIGAEDIPLINTFKIGYEQGAKYINPNIIIQSTYIGGDAPYSDPIRGQEHAISLANQGVDVIYHAAGNTGIGVFQTVKEKNIYGIGVDSDQDDIVKGKILTSMLKNVDNAVYSIIKETVENKFEGNIHKFGLKENGVGTTEYLYTKEIIGSKNIELVKELKEKIIKGEIEVKSK